MDKGIQADSACTPVCTESRPTDYPMSRPEAKAQGLKVFPAWAPCSKSSKHGNLRLTASNRCVKCVELEQSFEADLRAKAMDTIKAAVMRELRREMKNEIAKAHREAKAIVQAAERESKSLKKVQAGRQATRAAQQGPARPPAAPPAACISSDESAPWD